MLPTPHAPPVHSRRSTSELRQQAGIEPTASSWELVAAAQRGDREAFGRLYGRYVGPVGGFLASRVPDRALAAELTSETFLRALRRIDSVRDQGRDVGAWFTTIARNLIADHYKSSRTRLETSTGEFSEHGRFTLTGGQAPSPEGVVIERETAARLWRHVARLPEDQRECIRLRFAQGLSTAQAATAMNRSEDAVKALRHRALSGLRASLAAEEQPTAPAPAAPAAAGTDPLTRARQAIAAAQDRATTEERRATQERTRRMAGWGAGDRATVQRQRSDGAGLPVVAEGVT